MVGILAEKLELDGESFTLALAGSVLINEHPFASEVAAGLANWCEGSPRPVLVPEPALGAVQIAARRVLSR